MSREMKNSGIPWIGDIPKDWGIVRNKNVFSNSKILVGDAWNTTQLLSLTTKGIKAVAIGSTSGKVPDSYDTYQVVEKDNIVMCLFDLDCSAVFSGLSPIHGMISPAYKALTIKNGFLPDFYAKWFDYIFDGRKFMFLSKNIRYSLTYDEFASLQVVAPSLLEQQKIAPFLDRKCAEIDEMIALQERVIEELNSYKQAIITEVATKGLNTSACMVDSGIEWVGNIPNNWSVVPFRSYVKERSEKNKGEKTRELLALSYALGVTLYRDKVFNMDRVKNNYEDYQLVYEDDLVLSPNDIIKGSIYVSKYYGCISPMYLVCSARNAETHHLPYLSYLLRTKEAGRKLFYIARGLIGEILDNGKYVTRRMTVSRQDLMSFKVLLPPIDEQKAIVKHLDTKCTEIDNLISIKLSKIDSLNEYKKSIIYEYVTGKKEVTE